MKLSRRYQSLPAVATCATCAKVIEGDARAHAAKTGHQVRITETSLIIIEPATDFREATR